MVEVLVKVDGLNVIVDNRKRRMTRNRDVKSKENRKSSAINHKGIMKYDGNFDYLLKLHFKIPSRN